MKSDVTVAEILEEAARVLNNSSWCRGAGSADDYVDALEQDYPIALETCLGGDVWIATWNLGLYSTWDDFRNADMWGGLGGVHEAAIRFLSNFITEGVRSGELPIREGVNGTDEQQVKAMLESYMEGTHQPPVGTGSRVFTYNDHLAPDKEACLTVLQKAAAKAAEEGI